MATAAQIAANRRNALKSTGPRTPESKAASKFNALQHGVDAASIVIPGEDPEAYDALAADYRRQFHPQSAVEQFHVEALIRSDWQKRRLQRIEAKLYRALLDEGAAPDDLEIAVLLESPTAKLLRKVFAQIASLDRAYFRALNDVRRIQRENSAAPDPSPALSDAELLPEDLAELEELPSFLENRPAPAESRSSDNLALRL
jgi:hypothetical protein